MEVMRAQNKTIKLPEARENVGDQATINFSFESDWLGKLTNHVGT